MPGIAETPQSYKTTGTNNAPAPQITKQPTNDNSVHPYAIGGEDVTGYVGVDPQYKTYGDTRFKPLPVGQGVVEGEGVTEEVSESKDELSLDDDKAPKKASPAKAAK